MRVLHISSAKNFGGGERHLIDLCRGLKERGHEVFAAVRPTSDWQERLDFLPSENILHVSIRNSFGVFSAKRIADFARKNKIDIIHAHLARDYIPASISAALAKNAKFVLTRHVLFPMKPFYRLALKNLSRAIAVSDGVEKELRKIFPRKKIVVIPNGIQIPDYSEVRQKKLAEEFRFFHSIPFDAPLIGTIGELKILKGQCDFVLAAQEVAKKVPEAHFVIAGKDNTLDKSFRRELKRLVKVFELEDRFLWLDWLEDLAPLLAGIDIFVSPSHSESFGLAILEAMAAGKAIVATETEGAKEILGDTGLLVPIKDPMAMARAISVLATDADRRKDLAVKSRRRAAGKYSIDRMIDETENLYNGLFKGQKHEQ